MGSASYKRWSRALDYLRLFLFSSGRVMLRPPFLTGRENETLSVVATLFFPVSDGIKISQISFSVSCRYSSLSGFIWVKNDKLVCMPLVYAGYTLRDGLSWRESFEMVFACSDTIFVLKSWQADALLMWSIHWENGVIFSITADLFLGGNSERDISFSQYWSFGEYFRALNHLQNNKEKKDMYLSVFIRKSPPTNVLSFLSLIKKVYSIFLEPWIALRTFRLSSNQTRRFFCL